MATTALTTATHQESHMRLDHAMEPMFGDTGAVTEAGTTEIHEPTITTAIGNTAHRSRVGSSVEDQRGKVIGF